MTGTPKTPTSPRGNLSMRHLSIVLSASLAVLAMPVALPAALKYYAEKRVDLEAVLCIAPAFAAGGFLGAFLIQHLPDSALRLGLGLLLVYVGIRFLVHSDSEVAITVAGLAGATLAWTAYLGLRALGRRHLLRPDLGQEIRTMQERGRGDIDYHI